MIEIRNVTKSFGDFRVLDDCSATVAKGSVVVVCGPSGSGKSTLLNIVGLLDRPTSGHLSIAGHDTSALDDGALTRLRGHEIGFVFQYHHLLSAFTACENVWMPALAAREFPDADMRRRAEGLVERVGLTPWRDRLPGNMSGGQQQRVAIARALAMNPPLLLADEPTGNLDTQSAQSVFELLREVNREEGMAVLFVTHNLDLARRCDRIVHVVDGRLRQPVGLNGRQGAST